MKINLSVNPWTDSIIPNVCNLAIHAFDQEIKQGKQRLKEESYQGVSGRRGLPSLESGWDIEELAVMKNVQGYTAYTAIINTTPNSLERLIGQPPAHKSKIVQSRSSAQEELENIAEWAKVKLKIPEKQAQSVAYLIRRKIKRFGTERWRSQENYAGLVLKGNSVEYNKSGLVYQIEENIIKRLDKLNAVIPKTS